MHRSHPHLSIIVPIYNVEQYISRFLQSLDSQTTKHDEIEVILVDDGSLDSSIDLCHTWVSTTQYQSIIVSKINGGLSSARNAGLAVASGEWVTFSDPDDFLDENYIANVLKFKKENPEAELLVSNLTFYFDSTNTYTDGHLLRYRFKNGNRLVDLNRFPRYFNLSAATAFFKLSVIRDINLTFDERIRPVFEDAHFNVRYLLSLKNPLVGFIADAKYFYRRRDAGTSLMQGAYSHPGKYTDVLEYGYLDVLENSHKSKFGRTPEWLQNLILYDLLGIYRADERSPSPTSGITTETAKKFHQLTKRILSYIDPYVIRTFDIFTVPLRIRYGLEFGYRHDSWHTPWIRRGIVDKKQGLVQYSYLFTGNLPEEQFVFRGLPIEPCYSKIQTKSYLKKPLIHIRTVWLPVNGTVRVVLNNIPAEVRKSWPGVEIRSDYVLTSSSSRTQRVERKPKTRLFSRAYHRLERIQNIGLKAATALMLARRNKVYHNAWLLMDRSQNANDNAEHMFKYLVKEQPQVNSWFVLKKDSYDWRRLRSEGYGGRLLAHGSLKWMIASIKSEFLLSSHVDIYVTKPFDIGRKFRFKYVFLQHGVTKDDISNWLNPKPIFGLVTATQDEWASIAGDGSPYAFSPREVWLTGFPRHDRLEELRPRLEERSGPILIMPTWRFNLGGETKAGTGERLYSSGLADSLYMSSWRQLVASTELKVMADRKGAEVVFVPHPNLSAHLHEFDLPEYIRILSYEGNDIQKLIANSRMLVTDYSSIAFDAAFALTPIVYYQFDRDEVFGGAHFTKPGYFNYDQHGFGPVALNFEQVIAECMQVLELSPLLLPEYERRVKRTFTVPRYGASKRVYEHVVQRSSRLSLQGQLSPVRTPESPHIPGNLSPSG